jgi:hypothetical protein
LRRVVALRVLGLEAAEYRRELATDECVTPGMGELLG